MEYAADKAPKDNQISERGERERESQGQDFPEKGEPGTGFPSVGLALNDLYSSTQPHFLKFMPPPYSARSATSWVALNMSAPRNIADSNHNILELTVSKYFFKEY